MKQAHIIVPVICLMIAVLSLSSCKNEVSETPVLSAQEIDLNDYSSFFLLADVDDSNPLLWGHNANSNEIEEVKFYSSKYGLFHVSYCEKVGTDTIILYTFADTNNEARQRFVYNVSLRKAVEFNSKWEESICQARNGFYYRIGAECFYYDMETDASEVVFDGKIEETVLPYYSFYSTNSGNLLIQSGGVSSYTLYCKPLGENPIEIKNAENFKPFEQYSSGPWTYNGCLLTSPSIDYFIDLKAGNQYSITSSGLEVSPIDIAPVGEGRPIVSFVNPTVRGIARNYIYNCFTHAYCIMYFRNTNTVLINRIVDGKLETISYPLPSEMTAKDRDQMAFNDNKIFLYQAEEEEETTSLKYSLKYYDCITNEVLEIYKGTVLEWNPCGSGVMYVRYKNAIDFETVYYDCNSDTSEKIADKATIIRKTIWFDP